MARKKSGAVADTVSVDTPEVKARGRRPNHELSESKPFDLSAGKVDLKALEKAKADGERTVLRVLLPGHDRTRWEYAGYMYCGRDTHILFVPYHQNSKPEPIQKCYTASLDHVRLFDKSEPLRHSA